LDTLDTLGHTGTHLDTLDTLDTLDSSVFALGHSTLASVQSVFALEALWQLIIRDYDCDYDEHLIVIMMIIVIMMSI
jgi:hypothetical protein